MVTCKGSTRYWKYLEDYWPYAGGISCRERQRYAIAYGLIDLSLSRWRFDGPSRNAREGGGAVSKNQIKPGVWRISGLARDGTAEPVPGGQTLRREGAQGKNIFPVQLTTNRIGYHTQSAKCDD